VRRRAPVAMDRCGMALAAELLMEKWTMLIVREAFYGVRRFDDIREDIGIPRSVLTTRLKQLVEHGILSKEPYQTDGARARFQYILTAAGQELALTILAMMQWGDAHLKGGVPALEVHSRTTGKPLKVALVPQDANETALSDVKLNILDARDGG